MYSGHTKTTCCSFSTWFVAMKAPAPNFWEEFVYKKVHTIVCHDTLVVKTNQFITLCFGTHDQVDALPLLYHFYSFVHPSLQAPLSQCCRSDSPDVVSNVPHLCLREELPHMKDQVPAYCLRGKSAHQKIHLVSLALATGKTTGGTVQSEYSAV